MNIKKVPQGPSLKYTADPEYRKPPKIANPVRKHNLYTLITYTYNIPLLKEIQFTMFVLSHEFQYCISFFELF